MTIVTDMAARLKLAGTAGRHFSISIEDGFQPLDVGVGVGVTSPKKWTWCLNMGLGGGFNYFLFPPLFGEDSHLD